MPSQLQKKCNLCKVARTMACRKTRINSESEALSTTSIISRRLPLVVQEKARIAAPVSRNSYAVAAFNTNMSSSRDNNDKVIDDTVAMHHPSGESNSGGAVDVAAQASEHTNKTYPTTVQRSSSHSPISIASSSQGNHSADDSENHSNNDDGDNNDNEQLEKAPVKKRAQQKSQECPKTIATKRKQVEPANGSLHAPRDDTSLGILAKKVLQFMQSSSTGVVDLNELTNIMRVPKRRIYDITNVLEGVNLVKKCSKNVIAWTGPKGEDTDVGDQNSNDGDGDNDDYDEKAPYQNQSTSDADEDDDDGDEEHSKTGTTTGSWNTSTIQNEVQEYYQEETLLDTIGCIIVLLSQFFSGALRKC